MSTETKALDDLSLLQIDLAAVDHCTKRRDFDPLETPGAQMTDNDYRAGIRQVFSDHDEWEEWMVEPLLKEVKADHALQDQLMGILPAIARFM